MSFDCACWIVWIHCWIDLWMLFYAIQSSTCLVALDFSLVISPDFPCSSVLYSPKTVSFVILYIVFKLSCGYNILIMVTNQSVAISKTHTRPNKEWLSKESMPVFLLQLDISASMVWMAQLQGENKIRLVPRFPCNVTCSSLYAVLHEGETGKA